MVDRVWPSMGAPFVSPRGALPRRRLREPTLCHGRSSTQKSLFKIYKRRNHSRCSAATSSTSSSSSSPAMQPKSGEIPPKMARKRRRVRLSVLKSCDSLGTWSSFGGIMSDVTSLCKNYAWDQDNRAASVQDESTAAPRPRRGAGRAVASVLGFGILPPWCSPPDIQKGPSSQHQGCPSLPPGQATPPSRFVISGWSAGSRDGTPPTCCSCPPAIPVTHLY